MKGFQQSLSRSAASGTPTDCSCTLSTARRRAHSADDRNRRVPQAVGRFHHDRLVWRASAAGPGRRGDCDHGRGGLPGPVAELGRRTLLVSLILQFGSAHSLRLQQLTSQLTTDNFVVNNAILQTAHSIFRRCAEFPSSPRVELILSPFAGGDPSSAATPFSSRSSLCSTASASLISSSSR